MATFTYTPDFGASRASRPAVTTVRFGDGYEARQAVGINANLKSWTLTFAARTDSEANAIEAFLDARAGVESFDWTAPNAAASAKFVCREWQRTLDACNLNTIQATFDQLAEP